MYTKGWVSAGSSAPPPFGSAAECLILSEDASERIHGWHAQEFLFFRGDEQCMITLIMPTIMLPMLIIMLSLLIIMFSMLTIKLVTMILRTMFLIAPCI